MVVLLLLLFASGRVEAPVHGSRVAAGSRSLVAAVGWVVQVAPDLHREWEERHPLALHDVPVLEDVSGDAVVLDEFPRRLGARHSEQVVRGATVADAADAASVTDSVTSDVTAPSSITATTASTASVPRVDPSAATAAIGQAATEGQNARQQLKELCEKFSADLTIAEVTDVLVPKGSFSFEFAVDGLRCGVGSARSKKEAKEQAAALALRALAREPPRDL